MADLVLLNADPIPAIANAASISAVIFDGKVIDRSKLNSMLAELAASG